MPHFSEALDLLRDRAASLFGMGRSFGRLMNTVLDREPGILVDRLFRVWLWSMWAGRDSPDSGIDMVAEEEKGGLRAIQCKFFDPLYPRRLSTPSWRH